MGETYFCQVHGHTHHFFISYRVKSEAPLVAALKPALEKTGFRFLGEPISVFRDQDCLTDGKVYSMEFLSALKKSKVIIILLSSDYLETMIQKIRDNDEDNCLKEIVAALELKSHDDSVTIMPVAVMTKRKIEPLEYEKFQPWNIAIPVEPAFTQMREALSKINEHQIVHLHPQKFLENIYPLLNVLKPVAFNETTKTEVLLGEKFRLPEKLLSREELLRQLLLQVTETGVAVITALGGMGKTTLAKQFARFMTGERTCDDTCPVRHPQYEQVFFICCETEAQAFSDLEEIFQKRGEELMSKANSHFERHCRYLFIIDNLNDVSIADKIFTECSKFGGDVIITTRLDPLPKTKFTSKLIRSGDSYSKLMAWPLKTSKDYLLDKCEGLKESLADSDESRAFESILNRIDGFPLVISQFISYFETERPTLADLENRFSNLLLSHGGVSETRCLKAIVEISLENAGANNMRPVIDHFFFAMSFLEPSRIQVQLLDQLVANLKKENLCSPELEAHDIRKCLVNYGLLRRQTSSVFFTHALLQEIARDITTYDFRVKRILAETVIEVLGADPYSQYQFEVGSHVHHMSKFHVHSEKYEETWEIQIDRLSGLLFIYKGFFPQAREILETCLRRSEEFYGRRNHPDIALTLNKLGNCANAQEKYEDALRFYTEALEIFEMHFGRQNASVATILRCFGMVANSEGRLEDGRRYLEEALEIFKKVYGSRHQEVAATLNNLGNSLRGQKGYEEAIKCYEESLQIKVETVFKTRMHPSVATNLNNIGRLFYLQGKYDKAMEYLNECKEIRTTVFQDENHPECAMVLENISDVEFAQKNYTNACSGYAKVFSVYVTVYGDKHNKTMQVMKKRDQAVAASSQKCALM
ncbi:hypothetical protein HK096_001946 [Nowakowskiella sp. JEL0078]|nr:hypothetical protein HK096_001946 [Nowakowskiella sp. JEL0078]